MKSNMKPKKILYLITKSNFGGAQRYVYELAVAMKERGHNVTVAFGGTGLLNEKLQAEGIKTITINSFQRDISLLKEFSSISELYRLFKSVNPDVVHLNSSKAGGSGALVARFTGVKNIIYTAHGWAFWEPRPWLWRSLVYAASWVTALLVHKIILVSHYEANRVKFPLIKNKFSVIETAVPTINFLDKYESRNSLFSEPELNTHQGDHWLVTTAELNHNKNIIAAIDAVVEYNLNHSQKIFYCLMGDGDLRDQIIKHIEKHRAQNQIKLLGYVNDGRTYLKAFDTLLFPSLKEGMPYAVLEAGAAGLSVVASRVGGIPEIVMDGQTGLLIDPKNTKSITEALDKRYSDESLANTLALNLEQKVKTDFSLAKMIEKTETLY